MAEQPEKESWASSMRKAAPYMNLTYTFMSAIILLGAIGWWVDSRYDTLPAFFLVGLFTGFGLGMYQIYKLVKEMDREGK